MFPRLHLRWCASHAPPGYVHFPPRPRKHEVAPGSSPMPTPLNAKTAAARPRQALAFPIPSGRIPSTLAAIERLHFTLRFR
ncbi:hypothetical protein FB451DRAFT_1387872 [Mycena latifolia]|nr:hypothetical protein FB451DRAFT_1387872 [Mycena latifolia]